MVRQSDGFFIQSDILPFGKMANSAKKKCKEGGGGGGVRKTNND